MQIDDVDDCLEFARAWAGHSSFRDRMLDQANDMENCCNIIRDHAKSIRWMHCVRFLRWAADQTPQTVYNTTLTLAADIGWGIRTPG